MPRGPRIDYPGLLHHVIVRGIERKEIFKDKVDYQEFLKRLEKTFENTGAEIYAWVLMPNHTHLLIKIREKPLSVIMKRLLTGYAIYYNRRHSRVGYLYQGRYKSIVCEEEAYLLELVRYIHLNPLRVGLVKTIDELDKYKWCGYSVLMGKEKIKWQNDGEILSRFGRRIEEARRRYKEFVKDGVKEGKRDDLTGGGLIRSLGGVGEVLIARKNKEKQMFDQRILGSGDFVESIIKRTDSEEKAGIRKDIGVDELIKRVGKIYKIEPEKIINLKKQQELTKIKAIVVNIGINNLGISGNIFARRFNINKSRISRLNKLGEEILRDQKEIVNKILPH